MGDGAESIRALATVTLDARALEALGPETIDRLAELVEARLVERQGGGRGGAADAGRGGGDRGRASGDDAAGDPSGAMRSPATSATERGCGGRLSMRGWPRAGGSIRSCGRRGSPRHVGAVAIRGCCAMRWAWSGRHECPSLGAR